MKGRDGFTYTFELVPARASRGKALDEILAFARAAAQDGRLEALSITDNAGGHPALSPTALGREIKALGITPIIHFSCKDKNRNLIESQLFELDRHGLWELLVLTGDYPRYGFKGIPKPVFDIDSVVVLQMITQMKNGYALNPQAPGGGTTLPPMAFRPGCVVSPFKRYEGELVGQYLKLKRKIDAGAEFVITQMGYDARKFQELLFFLEDNGCEVPVYGTVFLPTPGLAQAITKGVVPGCVIPDALLPRMNAWRSGEKRERLEFGARLIAVLRGLGYSGVHISGPKLPYEDVAWMIERAEAIHKNWWDYVEEFNFPGLWDFYLYEKDTHTPLNSREKTRRKHTSLGLMEYLGYRTSSLVHELFFEKGKGLSRPFKALLMGIKRAGMEEAIVFTEEALKAPLFGCQMCGHCVLSEFAYLCPQSQCAKGLLNGPCGGSRDGWCEVWPGKKRCFYVRVYERLKALGHECEFLRRALPPRDWQDWKGSSWLKAFSEKNS